MLWCNAQCLLLLLLPPCCSRVSGTKRSIVRFHFSIQRIHLNMTDWDKELKDAKKRLDDAVAAYRSIEAQHLAAIEKGNMQLASHYDMFLERVNKAQDAYNAVLAAKREAEQQAQRTAQPGMLLRISTCVS